MEAPLSLRHTNPWLPKRGGQDGSRMRQIVNADIGALEKNKMRKRATKSGGRKQTKGWACSFDATTCSCLSACRLNLFLYDTRRRCFLLSKYKMKLEKQYIQALQVMFVSFFGYTKVSPECWVRQDHDHQCPRLCSTVPNRLECVQTFFLYHYINPVQQNFRRLPSSKGTHIRMGIRHIHQVLL